MATLIILNLFVNSAHCNLLFFIPSTQTNVRLRERSPYTDRHIDHHTHSHIDHHTDHHADYHTDHHIDHHSWILKNFSTQMEIIAGSEPLKK